MAKKEESAINYVEGSERPDAVSEKDSRIEDFVKLQAGLNLTPSAEEILEERRRLFELDQATEETSKVPATLDTVGALNSEQLANVNEIEDLDNFFDEAVDATELGHGFLQVEDKDFLVGRPFVIASYRFNPSDLNESGEFVTVFIVTKDTIDGRRKFFFNDGSDKSGIRAQMREIYNKRGRVIPVFCKKGLRKSEYDFTKPDGTKGRGITFYIDES